MIRSTHVKYRIHFLYKPKETLFDHAVHEKIQTKVSKVVGGYNKVKNRCYSIYNQLYNVQYVML